MNGMRNNLIRQLSSNSSKCGFFVTTPIYYVNANPHIGHLYSSVIGDAIHRWRQILDGSTGGGIFKFCTGTDEHGSKIQQAADKSKTSPAEYCEAISSQYKSLAEKFGISYTDFIRTSCDDRHRRSVEKFWRVLEGNGYIYAADYAGWYCVPDETFLTEGQLSERIEADDRKTIISGESGHPVEWTEERNYMFPLHKFQDEIKRWIKQNDGRVRPKKFTKIVLDALEEGPLPELSVSRPSSRVRWGLEVPGDSSQTVYVWLDALVNYLTASGFDSDPNFDRFWPPDVQVIGKDILKFHAIYWPAFLMAAGLEPPRSVLCHSHWTVDGEKMSKSKGNVVCPFGRSEIYTADGFRYFLLREGVAHSDGNYSDTKVMRILNSELADTLGNLLSRCSGSALNPNRAFPALDREAYDRIAQLDVTKRLLELVENLPETCRGHYAAFNFYRSVDGVVATLHQANLFFETLKPWELRKHPAKVRELEAVLHLALETLRVCGLLLQPIIPNIASNLLDRLSVPKSERYYQNSLNFSWRDANISQSRPLNFGNDVLFKRILSPSAEEKSPQKREKIKNK